MSFLKRQEPRSEVSIAESALSDNSGVPFAPRDPGGSEATTTSSNYHTPILWRIVFAQTAFCIQVSNNLGAPKPAWMTVSDKIEELLIPPDYLPQLQLSTSPLLIARFVVEKRSVPLQFTSYSEARKYVTETLGLNDEQEWHPNVTLTRRKGWFRWFSRR